MFLTYLEETRNSGKKLIKHEAVAEYKLTKSEYDKCAFMRHIKVCYTFLHAGLPAALF